jgi:hypothetical protein
MDSVYISKASCHLAIIVKCRSKNNEHVSEGSAVDTTTTIVVAIISLISSVIVACLTFIFDRRNKESQKKLDTDLKRIEFQNEERLKNMEHRNAEKLRHLEYALDLQKSQRNARLDYEYEARKRLYHELEPLIFLHVEDSDDAYHHIIELASMARSGTLSVKLGMSTDNKEDNYYLKATIYKLIRPMAVFRLMQRRLTSYDLQLEDYFRLQYILAKCLYFSSTDNYYVALGSKEKKDWEPCLICAFEGYLKLPEEKKEKSSHPDHIVYNILGITRGVIDNLANSLIKFSENDKTYRVMTFDEFEELHFGKGHTSVTPSMLKLCQLFSMMNINNRDFYPIYVLIWRILVLHACIYSIMKNLAGQKHVSQQHSAEKVIENRIDKDEINERVAHFLEKEALNFNWVIEDEKKCNPLTSKREMEEHFCHSLYAIKKYLHDWLENNYEEPVRPTKE